MTTSARALFITLSAIAVTLLPWRGEAQTAVSVSARVGDFHVAVSNYYHVPEREVVVIHDRHIPDDDLPVVLFIAQRASVPPGRIVDLRLRGLSWWDISVRYGLGPEVYYVPVAVQPGPPYGRAYGHYKKPRKEWRRIVLADDDIVNLVQLRFMSDYYRIPPERVMEVRGHQPSFVAVHQEISRGRTAGDDSRRASDDRGARTDRGGRDGDRSSERKASSDRGKKNGRH